MSSITITEALAEVKLVEKKIRKRREGIFPYLTRYNVVSDPITSPGGSKAFIQRELQGIADLNIRLIHLRAAIAKANIETSMTVGGVSRTIQEWLTWKREVVAGAVRHLREVIQDVNEELAKAQAHPKTVLEEGTDKHKVVELVVNLDLEELQKSSLDWEETFGVLDGQLSLMNATTVVEIAG